jgi:thiol-disulfide isomerase/thioredoxin
VLVRSLRQEAIKVTGDRLIWFSGRECVHCKRIRPTVEQFQAETGNKITELEVWHSEENAKVMRGHGEAITKACGGELGVPSFYNEKTGKALCGNVTMDRLKEWAL